MLFACSTSSGSNGEPAATSGDASAGADTTARAPGADADAEVVTDVAVARDGAPSLDSGADSDAAGQGAGAGLDASVPDAVTPADSAAAPDSGAGSDSSLVGDAGMDGNVSANAGGGTGLIQIYPANPDALIENQVIAVFDNGQPTDGGLATLIVVDGGGSSCVVQQGSPITGSEGSLSSAGTLTVSGGTSGFVLMPSVSIDGGTAEYSSIAANLSALNADAAPTGGLILPGDTLTITASGATVPAFSVTLGVPNDITLTSPDLAPDASSLTIANSADFPLAWSGAGDAGTLTFAIVQSNTTVSCTFPESAGGGVIPAAVLGYLQPEGGLSVVVQSAGTAQIDVDGWSIGATASGQVNSAPSTVDVVGSLDAGQGNVATDVDAAAGCPAPTGDSCTDVVPVGPPVILDCAADAPPTMTGGVIVPGTYTLLSDVFYLPAALYDSGLCTPASEEATLLIAGGCMQVATQNDDVVVGATLTPAGPTNTTNGSMLYMLGTGNSIATTGSCNAVPNASLTSTTTYTATATSVTLLNDYGDSVAELQTFLLVSPL